MFKSILKNRKSIAKQFSKVQLEDIQDEALRAKFKKLNGKQSGFTLLELLVVVAILAAIAGTAAIALQDTDARASAAAHVAMMDELNKGVRTFRVLNKNVLPNNFDSLMAVADDAAVTAGAVGAALLPNADGEVLGITDVAAGALPAGAAAVLSDIGMSSLRYVKEDATPPDTVATDCAAANIQATISNRGNAMVAGNIFNGDAGNGCGRSVTLIDGSVVAYWSGTVERLLGPGEYGDAAFDGTAMTNQAADSTAPILMAVGFGPSSNLFNANSLGGMTSVPVYRHVAEDQYNRFIGLFHVADSVDVAGTASIVVKDQVSFAAIVDGAGDTKEEELGEWDGTRNTI